MYISWLHFCTKERRNLERHERIYETRPEQRKPYPCEFDDCGYRASEKHTLEKHVKVNHDSGRTRDFQCPLCPSRFYSDVCLKQHIPRHLKEKGFRCIQCKFATHDRACLRQHTRAIHEKRAPLPCPFPGCSYTVQARQLR